MPSCHLTMSSEDRSPWTPPPALRPSQEESSSEIKRGNRGGRQPEVVWIHSAAPAVASSNSPPPHVTWQGLSRWDSVPQAHQGAGLPPRKGQVESIQQALARHRPPCPAPSSHSRARLGDTRGRRHQPVPGASQPSRTENGAEQGPGDLPKAVQPVSEPSLRSLREIHLVSRYA